MRTIVFTLLYALSTLFISCEGKPTPTPEPGGGGTPELPESKFSSMTFNFGVTKLPATSYPKPAIEDKITDLSVFIVATSQKDGSRGVAKAAYLSGKDDMNSVTLEWYKREATTYQVWVYANYGSDLTKVVNDMPFEKFEELEVTFTSEADFEKNGLPMAAMHDFALTDRAVAVTLKRKVAKIELNFAIAPGYYEDKIVVDSVTVNSAKHLYAFKSSKEYSRGIKYTSIQVINNQVVFYTLENTQGEVKEFTSTTERVNNTMKHPNWNSNVFFDTTYNNQSIETFFWVLGENATSDFNIVGDKHYTYNFTLDGTSEKYMTAEVSTVAGK